MKTAALSDIHDNSSALKAVMQDIANLLVDMTVNLGDIFSGGLQPKETADYLIPLNLPTIASNHERQILTWPEEKRGLSDNFAAHQLTQQQKEWLQIYQPA